MCTAHQTQRMSAPSYRLALLQAMKIFLAPFFPEAVIVGPSETLFSRG